MAINSRAIAQQQEEKEAHLSISKTLDPGNCKARIYDLQLMKGYKHDENGSLHLVIFLEGEDMGEGFEGFYLDPEDKDKGRSSGRVARVKASNFAFETKTIVIKQGMRKGEEVHFDRDSEIASALINIARAQGKLGEYDIHGETIEQYLALSKPILCNDVMLEWCIAGRQYRDRNGYDKWDLYLPFDKNKKKFPFSANAEAVIKFSKADHTKIEMAAGPVEEFAPTQDGLASEQDAFASGQDAFAKQGAEEFNM
jgi:hypothetical protein